MTSMLTEQVVLRIVSNSDNVAWERVVTMYLYKAIGKAPLGLSKILSGFSSTLVKEDLLS